MFSNFQEDFFEVETEKVERSKPISYNAKVCEPKWFISENMKEDEDGFIERLKFRADYLYYKQSYSEALIAYDMYFKGLVGNSLQMKRDFLEGKARCQLKCKMFNDAIQTAKNLEKEISNFDHLTVFCLLMCDIYQEAENFEAMVILFMKILVIHPTSSNCWMRLGKCYKQLSNFDETYGAKASACLFRARFLLEAGEANLNSFEATKCDKNLNEINIILDELDPEHKQITDEAILKLQEGILTKEESSSKLPPIEFFIDEISVKDYFNSKWLTYSTS